MKKSWIIFIFLIVAVCVLIFSPYIGMKYIPLGFISYSGGVDSEIFWQIRVPRTLITFIAGASLAISGMVFQAMFRNPLATPFTLGVSSGAALGAALYVRFGLAISLGFITGPSIAAFLGSIFSILLVYGLTQIRRSFSTASMLLAGVAVSFFFSSLILFIQYLSDFTHSFRIVRWLMGGVEVMGYTPVLGLLPFFIGGSMIVLYLTNELNLLLTGEDLAASRGVDVGRTRHLLFFATSLMVGGVIAVCGPIGFVGLMAPHISRLLTGPNHRYLMPATLLFGGAFLTLCDTFARMVIAPAEIPIGIITALIGGPFFIWLLLGGTSETSIF